ncbi:MAG TPA: hypothetical protein VGC63_04925 [Solirubrobacterales bacterium]|jgi:hypothetical protein
MADLTINTGDTFPAVRGSASDAQGLLDFTKFESFEAVLKRTDGSPRIIMGEAKPINPPITNPDEPDGPKLNWEYPWQEGDTTELDDDGHESAQGLYEVQLKVIVDSGTTPPALETLDNDQNPTVQINKALWAP